MFKIDSEKKLVALSAVNLAIVAPVALVTSAKNKAVKTAHKHPFATTVVAGVAGGVVLGTVLVNGEKVHPNSLYAKI